LNRGKLSFQMISETDWKKYDVYYTYIYFFFMNSQEAIFERALTVFIGFTFLEVVVGHIYPYNNIELRFYLRIR